MTDKPMKPLLMCGPMVRAYMEGRKTATRRVMVPQPSPPCHDAELVSLANGDYGWWLDGEVFGPFYKPRYQPGDILWVRETWMEIPWADGVTVSKRAIYRATDEEWFDKSIGDKWRPSIFMPRKYARLFLGVIDVRAEQLQDITEEDAIAEGMELLWTSASYDWKDYQVSSPAHCLSARDSFMTLWDKLNSKRGYPWSGNPWVFRYGLGKEKG